MRKGLSPYRRDPMNRTALFWAVKVSVCVCGCRMSPSTLSSPLMHCCACDNTFRIALCSIQQSGRVAAARFLVKCGCDTEQLDTTGAICFIFCLSLWSDCPL